MIHRRQEAGIQVRPWRLASCLELQRPAVASCFHIIPCKGKRTPPKDPLLFVSYLFSEIKHYRESLLDLCIPGGWRGAGDWGASDLGRGEATRWRTPPTLMSARRLPQQAPGASCTRVPQPLLRGPSPRGGRLRCSETRLTAETGSNEDGLPAAVGCETHTPPSPRAGARRGTVTGRGWKGRLELSLPAWPHSSSPSPPEQGSPAPVVGRARGTLTEGHSPPHVPAVCPPRTFTRDVLPDSGLPTLSVANGETNTAPTRQ